ncbi:RelA/SpoT family protein [Rhodoflexus sp.]
MKDDPHLLTEETTAANSSETAVKDSNVPIKDITGVIPVDEKLEQERKEILRRYRHILRKVSPVLKNPKEDVKRIKAAFEMAEEAHRNERRKSGEPYIYHPLEVARIVVEEIGLGATSVICAFLHDVVEDTNITIEDIRRKFGDKEAHIIDGLTKIKGTLLDDSTTEQIENFRKVLFNLSQDIRVVLIKIADRLHNMRTLDGMRRDKQLRTISETQLIYAPLAHRLGLYEIKSELEDLCLKYKSPEIYNDILRKIKKTQPARDRFVKNFIKPIDEKLRERGFQFTIKSRVKSVASIYNKMEKQKIPFEEVYDLFAIRIILDSPYEREKDDCWVAYCIVTDFYQSNPERMRDWIGNPRSNGYESLHITVMSDTGQWVEVQIRTKRMDEIAEKGLAAHWKYKEKLPKNARHSTNSLESWLNRIRETLENRDLDALEMMGEVHKDLHEEEVYVFTPKGQMKILRNGSTVLDFAFMIHTDLGLHCLGAKVNGKLVPISYVLKNGEKVEIIKSSLPKATSDWLKIANNKRTHSKINQFLNSKRNSSVEKGREIIKRKIEQMNIQVPQTEEFRLKLAKKFGQNSIIDFEEKLGKGELDHTQLKEAIRTLLQDMKKQEKVALTAPEKSIKSLKATNSGKLMIGGQSGDILYTLAKCCSPVRGDEVIGYMTVSRRLMVHRIDCVNAVNQMAKDNSKVIPLEWVDEEKSTDKRTEVFAKIAEGDRTQPAQSAEEVIEVEPEEVIPVPPPAPMQYEVVLSMYGFDRDGIVNEVTQAVHTHKVSMRSITMGETEGMFEGQIVVRVKDIEHLDGLIKDLEKLEGIKGVKRSVL